MEIQEKTFKTDSNFTSQNSVSKTIIRICLGLTIFVLLTSPIWSGTILWTEGEKQENDAMITSGKVLVIAFSIFYGLILLIICLYFYALDHGIGH